RPVVADGPVAVQLHKLIEDQLDVIERLRPVQVPGYFDGLPGREIAIDLALEIDEFPANAADLLARARPTVAARFHLGEQFFELLNFGLEGQPLCRHLRPQARMTNVE